MNTKKARIIAYYLPQYHPVPLNDEWWGKGFTEWTNVGKAKPLFKGHYQPRVPADLGYYDLRLPHVRSAQAELAQQYGIEGFMYWNYWFGNGNKILEMPLQEILKTKEPDFPFCLGWANHSWSNHEWNSNTQWKKKKHLVEQLYPGKDDYINHFNYLLNAFKDERYLKIDNKPIFLVYAPLSIPNPSEFIDLWQKLALLEGLPGIYFIGLGNANNELIFKAGFDAINSNGQWAAETYLKGKLTRILYNKVNKYIGGLKLDIYDYRKIIDHLYCEKDKSLNVFPTIIPQWDRSARSGRRAVIYKGSTPELFEKNIINALDLVKNKPQDRRIIFLKSWNEWAEGNYVEPDIIYGHGYLQMIKKSLM